ncbi:MAG TPA: pilus assembly protein N-terminal domain-containing protein [Afifellaceae bacterium]|nr:pilus assembly protein N-terminal domain-containing protein [Afifellaceae bacterium]
MSARFATAGRKALTAAAGGLFLSLAVSQPSLAGEKLGDTVALVIDFAKIITLDEPVSTIVIGNSGIADAAMGDDRTIVLTGKAAGTTNMILIGRGGEQIANATVRVASDTRHLTTVFRGKDRQTFSCAPTCEQVIAIGDAEQPFSATTTQIKERQAFSGLKGAGE